MFYNTHQYMDVKILFFLSILRWVDEYFISDKCLPEHNLVSYSSDTQDSRAS